MRTPARRLPALTPAVALALAAAACLEYGPHVADLDASERDLHARALARLAAAPPPGPLRFAVVGDVHLWFAEVEDAIAHLNARDDLAFVVQLGDFTHLGLVPELRAMVRRFEDLRAPWFVVIGNHDHLGNGEALFREAFGGTALAFTVGRTRVVLADTNSREAGFDGSLPDLPWLRAQLEPDGSFDRAVVLAHVPPGNDDFDPRSVEAWDAALRAHGPVLAIHGHEHRRRTEERQGTPVQVLGAVESRRYLVVTLPPGGGFEVEEVPF